MGWLALATSNGTIRESRNTQILDLVMSGGASRITRYPAAAVSRLDRVSYPNNTTSVKLSI